MMSLWSFNVCIDVVCEKTKLRVNAGNSKIMRCTWYRNGARMHVLLNGAPLEEADCFKYLGSQVAADEECERVHRTLSFWYTE